LVALLVASGGLALAARAFLSDGSARLGAADVPIVAPTPSFSPSTIPDDSPGGPELTYADRPFPNPSFPGEEIEWNMYWKGSSGLGVRAVVCKTPEVVEGECPGGAWAYGRPDRYTPSLAHLTVSLDYLGTNPYYAFACDENGDCSEGRSGIFRVERRPVLHAASHNPDVVVAGETVTFRVEWSEPDGDEVQAWICREDGVAWGGCGEAYWAESAFSDTGVSTASYRTTQRDVLEYSVYEHDCERGKPCVQEYWVYVCDRSGACTGSIHGNFTVVPRPA
jgi:hypothetical protein